MESSTNQSKPKRLILPETLSRGERLLYKGQLEYLQEYYNNDICYQLPDNISDRVLKAMIILDGLVEEEYVKGAYTRGTKILSITEWDIYHCIHKSINETLDMQLELKMLKAKTE